MYKGTVLTIIRGLPGSGKTTKARKAQERFGAALVSADDYFERDGEYRFNPAQLPAAHAACQAEARRFLASGRDVIVHNTFTQGWEATPYVNMASEFDAALCVVEVFDGGLDDAALAARNVHGVPQASIAAMRARWDNDLLAAQQQQPLAPWERA
jgi:predicted kinase